MFSHSHSLRFLSFSKVWRLLLKNPCEKDLFNIFGWTAPLSLIIFDDCQYQQHLSSHFNDTLTEHFQTQSTFEFTCNALRSLNWMFPPHALLLKLVAYTPSLFSFCLSLVENLCNSCIIRRNWKESLSSQDTETSVFPPNIWELPTQTDLDAHKHTQTHTWQPADKSGLHTLTRKPPKTPPCTHLVTA